MNMKKKKKTELNYATFIIEFLYAEQPPCTTKCIWCHRYLQIEDQPLSVTLSMWSLKAASSPQVLSCFNTTRTCMCKDVRSYTIQAHTLLILINANRWMVPVVCGYRGGPAALKSQWIQFQVRCEKDTWTCCIQRRIESRFTHACMHANTHTWKEIMDQEISNHASVINLLHG